MTWRIQATVGYGPSARAWTLNDPDLQALTAVSQRPSFDVAGDSIRALVPSSNGGRDMSGILGIPLMYTERFLLTTHSGPCLAAVQHGWDDLPHDVKADGPSLLFFILNQLIGSFEPNLVQLDSKLDQIQLALLGGSPPGVEGELIRIRRELSEAVQALGWYVGDLHHFDSARQLPGMDAADESGFDVHARDGPPRSGTRPGTTGTRARRPSDRSRRTSLAGRGSSSTFSP